MKAFAVVGAGGDIGRHLASGLDRHGHKVVAASRRDCDVTSSASVDSFIGYAWPFDGIAICHGAPGCIKPSINLTDEEIRRIIEIDLIGSFRVARQAARYMLSAGSGNIVFFSSIHAIATYPQRAAYAAAKAGVVGMMRALAIEWASRGVRVNAILPGQVEETRRTARIQTDPRLLERSPSGSLVSLDAIIEATEFLLSTTSVTGHALVVDEGWTASAWFKGHNDA